MTFDEIDFEAVSPDDIVIVRPRRTLGDDELQDLLERIREAFLPSGIRAVVLPVEYDLTIVEDR